MYVTQAILSLISCDLLTIFCSYLARSLKN